MFGSPVQTSSLPAELLLPSVHHLKTRGIHKPLAGSRQNVALSHGEVWGGRSGPPGQMEMWSPSPQAEGVMQKGTRGRGGRGRGAEGLRLGLAPAEALMQAQIAAAGSRLSSGLRSRGKAVGLVYDSSRYRPSPKWAYGNCVITYKIHRTERKTCLSHVEKNQKIVLSQFNGPDEYLWAENPLENLFVENQFPPTGNLKVLKEVRVSQPQRRVHMCPSTRSPRCHTADFQLWATKDVIVHLYLEP